MLQEALDEEAAEVPTTPNSLRVFTRTWSLERKARTLNITFITKESATTTRC